MLISFLKDYPRESCDYSVCNLLTWGKIYNNQFCHYQGRLVVYNTKHSYVFFPMGEYLPAAELAQLLRGFKEIDPKVTLIQIPEEYVSSTPEIHDYFELSENRDWDDYVYSCQKMVELRGKKLAKKKNLISQFRRLYPDYKVLRITPYYVKTCAASPRSGGSSVRWAAIISRPNLRPSVTHWICGTASPWTASSSASTGKWWPTPSSALKPNVWPRYTLRSMTPPRKAADSSLTGKLHAT